MLESCMSAMQRLHQDAHGFLQDAGSQTPYRRVVSFFAIHYTYPAANGLHQGNEDKGYADAGGDGVQVAVLPGCEMAMEGVLLDQNVARKALHHLHAADRLVKLTLHLMQSITTCRDIHLPACRRLLVAFLSAFSEEPSPVNGTTSDTSNDQVSMQIPSSVHLLSYFQSTYVLLDNKSFTALGSFS